MAELWGVLGGQQFKSLGNVVKLLDRLGIMFECHDLQRKQIKIKTKCTNIYIIVLQ